MSAPTTSEMDRGPNRALAKARFSAIGSWPPRSHEDGAVLRRRSAERYPIA